MGVVEVEVEGIGGASLPDCVLAGLIGNSIQASRTPRMHMDEGAALGFPYEYRLIDLPRDLEEAAIARILAGLEDTGYRGVNVTVPYKRDILTHLDALSDDAHAVGAVNTVLFTKDGRIGHNTDYWGFAESLRRGLPDVARDKVLLMGAGGAGHAVAHALVDSGVGTLLVCDTNRELATSLVSELNERAGAGRAELVEDVAEAAKAADGIVNATPVGMLKMPGMPIDGALVEPRHWVADIVYFPLETKLLAHARGKGCAVLSGAGMALFQAVRAFELFTGVTPDADRMKAVFDSFD
ncbi:shikimate dehydrogenase [Nisaea nitritireducens]|uniref:shikimate dehydrogenase n=1 Tax=Nisaea nitritireducens TaxID=568392 RepID=UPI001866894F|nr:shikimate dehydrogenase [Nisaea nitritireducens]